ncbi:hypothetical protein B0G80_7093 [Paraburkholderia sp. BL6669N2]|nr:hypothetical protein B0G80_7093 [Paraburkholderia sp. BL6669N2]
MCVRYRRALLTAMIVRCHRVRRFVSGGEKRCAWRHARRSVRSSSTRIPFVHDGCVNCEAHARKRRRAELHLGSSLGRSCRRKWTVPVHPVICIARVRPCPVPCRIRTGCLNSRILHRIELVRVIRAALGIGILEIRMLAVHGHILQQLGKHITICIDRSKTEVLSGRLSLANETRAGYSASHRRLPLDFLVRDLGRGSCTRTRWRSDIRGLSRARPRDDRPAPFLSKAATVHTKKMRQARYASPCRSSIADRTF